MQDNPQQPNEPRIEGVPEADLHAWVDGRHGAGTAQRVLSQAAQDEALAHQLSDWQGQRQRLQSLHRGVLDESVPPALLAAADAAARARDGARQWLQRGAVMASIVLAFGAGWLGNGQWRQGGAGTLAATQFARQAAIAHVVFQPEVRHPVEVTAAQQDHLVQWLSKRVGRPLKVPMLAAQGYELVGGRLLSGDAGARAQFMFQNAAGERITLYVGAVQPGTARAGETAFSFLDSGAAPGFYWVDQGFGYALSGQLPRAALLDLASAVYAQLEPQAAGTSPAPAPAR